ncbi:MAG TPA: DUF2254 domain-containing protein [Solirubrobacteraceae bacterium]|nr:DUF2254 domain-containing protein [Solirubrobacteraceae bacterium]
MYALRRRLEKVRERFWVLPALAITAAIAAAVLLPMLDRSVALPDTLAVGGQEENARAVLTAIAALAVSVAGVSFSVIVVALVLAAQQLSPRVLRSFQRQSMNQAVLAMLLGTATYALFVLASISERREPVPELSVTVAMLLAAASLGLFVVFLHHAVRSLNASVVIRRIAADGHNALERPYPQGVGEPAAGADPQERWSGAARHEVRAPRAGYVSAVDGSKLLRWARANDAFVEQRRAVGSFVVTGVPLAVVYRQGADDIDCSPVGDAFVIAEERVVEGDIGFPLRQLVDIALKGLSPSVNDPTTAENAMDSVTDTLARFAQREPVDPLRLDEDGVPRLQAIAPTLDDLVRLAFDQVRHDAAGRPPFAVRLLELLADLRTAAPAAARSREIARQAELITEQAIGLVEHEADRQLVAETYGRLHAHEDVA